MRKKSWTQSALIVMFILLFTCGSAMAAPAMYTCNVVFVGVERTAGQYYVKLSDVTTTPGAFTNHWWRLDTDTGNAQLATILTAMSLEKTVDVWLESDYIGTQYSYIYAIYMNAE